MLIYFVIAGIICSRKYYKYYRIYIAVLSTALRCGSFSEKALKKKHLCRRDKNYYYFWKSNISVIIRENIFACLFSVHNTTGLSRHGQVCLIRLRFEWYFSHHQAQWWERYISKRSLTEHACSWRDKLILLYL